MENASLRKAEEVLKVWKDKTNEEKLEVLRDEIRNNRWLVSRISKLEQDLRSLQYHDHKDGKVLVPLQNTGSGLCGTTSSPIGYDKLA